VWAALYERIMKPEITIENDNVELYKDSFRTDGLAILMVAIPTFVYCFGSLGVATIIFILILPLVLISKFFDHKRFGYKFEEIFNGKPYTCGDCNEVIPYVPFQSINKNDGIPRLHYCEKCNKLWHNIHAKYEHSET